MIELTREIQNKVLASVQNQIDKRFPIDGEWTQKMLNSYAKISAETTLQVLAELQKLENQE